MANGSVLAGVRPNNQPVDLAGSLLGGQQARQSVLAGQQQLQQGQMQLDRAPKVAAQQDARAQQQLRQGEQQISENDFMRAVQRGRIINRLAKQVRDLPAGQRPQFVQSLDPEMLQSVGIDPAQIQEVGLDDQSLDAIIAQTGAAIESVDGGDQQEPRFGKVNPGDYTPESLSTYRQTGNFADLVPRETRESRTSSERDFETYQRLLREDPERAEAFGRQAGFVSREGQELSSYAEKRLGAANDEAVQSASAARNYEGLAQDFAQSDAAGGTAAQWSERLKQITGSENALSRMRQEYRQIRNTEAVKNLPPGVASDKDIELALSGFPSDTSNADYIASFMRGMSKMAQSRAQYNEFKAEYISREGTERGFLDAWRRETEGMGAPDVGGQTDQGGQAPQTGSPRFLGFE